LPILSNLEAFEQAALKSGSLAGLLALDVSRRALGLAGADPSWQIATPLLTIRRTRLAKDVDALKRVIDEREAGALVIGWPLNMDGSEGPRCQAIRQFARDLDAALGLPMLLWDERLSTFEAEERAAERGLAGRKKDEILDAYAAASILEDMLNARRRTGAG
jgi:putative Holliday junction resolvase